MKIYFDLHTHTTSSGHAFSTFKENLEEAASKGLYALGMSDHAPAMPGSAQAIYFTNFKCFRPEVMGVRIYTGVEANIMDFKGNLDLDEAVLKKMDYVIASLHMPCIRPGTPTENTDALIGAMENPYVKIIGHPDDDRYPLEYERLIPAALKHRVALEVNNSSFNPRSGRQNSGKNVMKWLSIAKEYRLPVILGSDAHIYYDVGDMTEAVKMLKAAGYPPELVLNAREDGIQYVLNR